MKKTVFILSFFLAGIAISHAQDACDSLKIKISMLYYSTEFGNWESTSEVEGAIINIDSFPVIYFGIEIINVSTDTFFMNETFTLLLQIDVYTNIGFDTSVFALDFALFPIDFLPNDIRGMSSPMDIDLTSIVNYMKELGVNFDEITFCILKMTIAHTSKDGYYTQRVMKEGEDTAKFYLTRNEVDIKGLARLQNNISVFPNPAQSQITITDVQGAVLRLYNTLGQEIVCFRNEQENAIINTSHFPQGLYVLKVEKENAALTRKIQIMR